MTLSEIKAKWEQYRRKPELRRDLWERLTDANLRGWFEACRKAVQAGDAQALSAWLVKIDTIEPFLLECIARYVVQMVRAHLYCALVAVEKGRAEANQLKEIADKLGSAVPVKILRDLTRSFLGEGALPTLVLPLLLIDTAANEGVVADVTLELVPDGDGSLYPSSEMAFVPQDDDFQNALNDAKTHLQRIGLWGGGFDVRWRVKMREHRTPPSMLVGNSAGAAFALGLARLLMADASRIQERHELQKNREKTPFSDDGEESHQSAIRNPQSAISLPTALARLGESFLNGVATTATVRADGHLGKVGGVFEKLLAAAKRGSLPQIHTVVVANGTEPARFGLIQVGKTPQLFKDPNVEFFMIEAAHLEEAGGLLAQRALPPIFTAPAPPKFPVIGRDALLQSLKEQLFSGRRDALIALTGLPGVGKTTIAIEIAHDPSVREHFRDGILWAGLGREGDIFYHLGRWALSLGISSENLVAFDTVAKRRDAVRDAIGQRRMLLVVDDVWDARAVRDFNLGGPNGGYLFTTRSQKIALEFAGEEKTEVEELNAADALTLLAKLAPKAVKADPDEAKKLVQALGSLPLALILMGNFLLITSSVQPDSLRQAIQELHTAEERLKQEKWLEHPSLQEVPISLLATIGLSDDALDKAARDALRALSVIPPKPNTFSEEAALAVSALSVKTPLDELETSGLMQRSESDRRYTLHQTISDYARTQLTDETAYERMVTFFVHYVDEHQNDLPLLDLESENIFESLRVASNRGRHEDFIKCANELSHFMGTRGMYRQSEGYLKYAVEVVQALNDAVGLATVYRNLGVVVGRIGDYERAESYLQEGLKVVQSVGDQKLIGGLHHALGTIAFSRGTVEQAEKQWRKSLAMARQSGENERIGPLLSNLGVLAGRRGDLSQAEKAFQEALPWARQLGQKNIICDLMINLGELEKDRGDYQKAEAHLREGLSVAQEMGYKESIGHLFRNFGVLAYERGEYAQALGFFKEGLKTALEIEQGDCISLLHQELGATFLKLGEIEQAKAELQEGLNLARTMGYTWLVCNGLNGWGDLYIKEQEFECASAAFRESKELAEETGFSELAATALYGLARIAAAQGDATTARLKGQEVVVRFEKIGHKKPVEVKAWLSAL
ncbi:tetratricopeptide repeat protein [Candidatus Poribacteria bacterium]|nr:tetratricopeptide repeat protein [Candidatus Poribacteria bacterium]